MTLRELHPETITDTVNMGLENFVFGPTQVITDRWISYLGGWLPDNERLLVAWYVMPLPEDIADELEGIGTYNVHTGEFVEYGQRHRARNWQDPVWLPGTEQIAFEATDGIWISGTGAQRATGPVFPERGHTNTLAGTANEAIIVMSTTHQLATLDAQGTLTPLPVDLDELGLDSGVEMYSPCAFRMRTNPDRSKIALVGCVQHEAGSVWKNYMMYLVDLTDYSVQEAFDLRSSGLDQIWRIEWSLDGNYVALVNKSPDYVHGLWVLNVRGAELTRMDVPSWNVIWSPDSRYLVMFDDPSTSYSLLDLQSGARLPVLTEGNPCQEPLSSSGGNWWSSDGSQLVLLDQFNLWLCLVNTHIPGGEP